MLSALITRIEGLKQRLDRDLPVIHWGTVASLDPLRVRKDHAETAWALTPSTIYRPRAVGERVLLLHIYKRLIILGRAGGDPASEPGTVEIDGQVYATSGAWPEQALSNPNVSKDPVYAWSFVKPAPYVPPVGWTFAVHLVASNGYTAVGTGGYADGDIRVRVININSAAPVITLGWRLVRTG